MPTVQIVGFSAELQATPEAQKFALETLPAVLAGIEGLGVEPGVVRTQYLTDGVRREAAHVSVHVFDLFVTDARTPDVRTAAAHAICGAVQLFCGQARFNVGSIWVCLGAFVADEHGYAAYP